VHTEFWWDDLRENKPLGNLDVAGRMKLKWIIMKWDWGVWTGLIWPRTGPVGGHL